MVRAWYMDKETAHPKELHHRIPPKFVTLEELHKITGIEYFEIDPEDYKNDQTFKTLVEERGNKHVQNVENPDESQPKNNFAEHFHTDDEFRLALKGCGYYDVRDKNDEWIRVEIFPGDLLVIPGGCYHRFVMDKNNLYVGLRVLKDECYQAHNRPSDDMKCRQDYVTKLANGEYDKAPS